MQTLKTVSLFVRNRLPTCSDDLSHWSDIFCWRQLHYKHLVKAYENSPNTEQVLYTFNNTVLSSRYIWRTNQHRATIILVENMVTYNVRTFIK